MKNLKMTSAARNGKLKSNNSALANGHAKAAREPDDGARLFDGRFQAGVGVYDGITALLADKWNFDFLWVSSFCCSAAAGLPDAGIIGPEDILSVVRCVGRTVEVPMVVDLDCGYGDPMEVFHVAEAMGRAGAAAMCIEDNPISKRCSLYDGYKRVLVSIDEHTARLQAALAAVVQANATSDVI